MIHKLLDKKARQLSLRLLWGSLWRRRARWAIALSAVAIGASVAAGLLLVSRDVERQVSHELKVFGPNLMIVPDAERATSGMRQLEIAPVLSQTTLNQATVSLLDQGPSDDDRYRLGHSLPLLYGAARALLKPLRWETVLVAGTDLPGLEGMYGGWRRRPSQTPVASDRIPAHVGRNAAARLVVAPGDTLTLIPLVAGGAPLSIQVENVFDAGTAEDDALYLPLADAQQLLALPGRVSLVLARAEGLPADIESAVAGGWLSGPDRQIKLLRRMSTAEQEILDRLGILFGLITGLALLAATLCAMSTLTDMVLERRREVALLKSLGAGKADVFGLFLLEAIVLGLAGGTLGFLIGATAAQVIGQSVFASPIRLDFSVFVIVLAVALGVTLLASFLPVRNALAVEPATVLRGD